MKREMEVGRFLIRTEGGHTYTVIQYQAFVDATSHDSPGGRREWMGGGLISLATDRGQDVIALDGGRFQIVQTGEIGRKL